MYLKIYLNDDEYAAVKEKGDGWVRKVVQRELGVPTEIKVDRKPKESHKNIQEIAKSVPGVSVGLPPKSQPKKPGFCVNGHYAGHMKVCPMCKGKVY